jgi:Big-like domain-containing protein
MAQPRRIPWFQDRWLVPAFWQMLSGASLLALGALMGPPSVQAQAGSPAYESGPGHASVKGHHVPFERGPVGPDGKILETVPDVPPGSKPRGMTEEGKRIKALVEKGLIQAPVKPLPKVVPSLAAGQIGKQGAEGQFPTSSPSVATASALASQPSSENSFPGISGGAVPPDVGMSAGPFQIVATVNSFLRVFDKNGNLLSGGQSLSTLFAPVGPAASDFLFDPSTVYDPYINRFWLLATSNNNSSRSTLLLALSNSNDLTSGWTVFALDATLDQSTATSHWCDYPHMGIDAQAIYLTCNMFTFPSPGGSFQYAKIRVMTKSQFVNNTCCSWWDFFNMHEGFFNAFPSFTIQPAVMHGASAADGEFLVDSQGGGAVGNTLTVWQILNAQNCCNGSGVPPVLNETGHGVSAYLSPRGGEQPLNSDGSAPPDIDTGDARLLSATWQAGHLSTTQTSDCSTGFLAFNACAAFYELDVSAYPTISTINDWALQSFGVDRYYPAVDQNAHSDKALVYGRSSRSEFVGADFTTIPNSGACTNCFNGETSLAPGLAIYNNVGGGQNRWGDYFTAAADPDGLGVWVDGQFAIATTTWGTRIGSTFNNYAPSLSLSTNPISFGSQTVFTTSGSMDEFITNTGNANLDIGGISISGDPDFFIVFDGCSFQAILQGHSCVVAIRFGPQSAGPGNATLNVPSNAPFATAAITGTGVKALTSTTLASSANPAVFGQSITFTATVTSPTPGTPTGTVTFKDCFGHPFCVYFPIGTGTLSGGVASITISGAAVGNHSIQALYSGDADFGTSFRFMTQTVDKDASVTLLSSSKNPSAVGTAVTFTAAISAASPGSGTPSGTVIFKDGATTLGSVALSAGKAALTISTLAMGSHSITATYGGDGNFNGSSGALTQAIRQTTSTTVASSNNPSVFGQAVHFTATVTPNTVTGTVTFRNGAVVLGTSSVTLGKATLSTSTLAVGAHAITATYNGSTIFLASTSAVLAHAVNKAASSTAVTSSHNPSVFGQSVSFTATVTAVAPGTGTPTGSVTFKNGLAVLGSVSLISGKATFSTSALTVGAHSVTAVYNGSVDYNTSTSSVLTQTVNKAATSTALTSSPNPSTLGQTVTFKVTVAAVAPGSGAPTGSVTLKDGATALGTVPLVAGKASLATSLLAHGNHAMTAVYVGSANNLGSTSAVHTQTVN